MANSASKRIYGIDVAKDQLVICHWATEQVLTLTNQPPAIQAWLDSLHEPVRLALEPTAQYHLPLLAAASASGHSVYLVNPRQLAHYRQAVNVRHKSDPHDAWLLARFLAHEGTTLQSWQPQDPRAQRLWALLQRRATLVQSRQQLQQSFQQVHISIQALLTQFQQLLQRLDRQIEALIRALGWWPDFLRCRSVPGIGPVTAAALVASYRRGAFAGSDAFVAYLGLDVRLRESGRFKGQRKLTKCGPAELRRLLYCAAHPARTHVPFADYYQRQLEHGRSRIAARVALARKLARIAFTLMHHQTSFAMTPKPA